MARRRTPPKGPRTTSLPQLAGAGLALAATAVVLHLWVLPRSLERHILVDTVIIGHMIPGVAALSMFLDWATAPIGAATALVALWRSRAWAGWTTAAARAVAGTAGFGVAWASGEALKVLFARARPDFLQRTVEVSLFSFPSGHSAFAGGLLLLAWMTFPRRVVAVYAVGALAVAISRMVLGVHWPTDVLGGLGWGLGMAALVAWGLLKVAPPDPRHAH